jgi:glycosyltransferase involved in cell wall biosynthesis
MTISRIVIINDASRALGGATGLALLSAHEFLRAGLPVTYVCGDAGEADDLRAAGARVIAAGRGKLLTRGRADAAIRGIHDKAMRDMLADLIADHDDPGTVYHVHGWAQILSPAIFTALAAVAPRCFIHAHDMFLACPNGVYMDYRRNRVCTRVPLGTACLTTNCDKRSYLHKGWRVARQIALRRCLQRDLPWAGILAIHPAMVPRLARAGYPDRLFHVLRNPAAAFTSTRITAESNTTLAYVGRLEPDKGALDLAQAARRTGQRVIFVGEGSLRGVLERDFPEMSVTGWQDRDAIGALIGDARVLVMPSHHPEPFALVLPEASLSGLPLAVADTALMAPEIQTAGLGVSFDVFDAASFDRALTTLRHMPAPDLRAMSERGHANRAGLAMSIENWVDELLSLYARALET